MHSTLYDSELHMQTYKNVIYLCSKYKNVTYLRKWLVKIRKWRKTNSVRHTAYANQSYNSYLFKHLIQNC